MSALALNSRIGAGFLSSFCVVGCFFTASVARAVDTGDSAALVADKAVREALQREVYGLDGDRRTLLSAAEAANPDFAPARWHQGYVRSSTGEWTKAGDKPDVRRQALLMQYEKRRAAAANTVAGQMELADWCDKHHLSEQERVHLLRVCELSPDHPAARQRLGFTRSGRDWVSREEREKNQRREEAVRTAAAKWTPIVKKAAEQLDSTDQKTRLFGRDQLKSIVDPAALPTLEKYVATKSEACELFVVEIAAQMTDPEATAAIARSAVFSNSLEVRKAAAEHLKTAEQDRFVPLLVSSMYTPVVSQVSLVALPSGRIGYRHAFLREGSEKQELLQFDTEYRRRNQGGTAADARAMAMFEAQETASQLERQAERQNAATRALNDRIAWVLCEATGAKLPAVPDDWWAWWNNENEVFFVGSKPVDTITVSRSVAVADAVPDEGGNGGGAQDCLLAGTPVWTEQGQVAIEKLRAGDLVLSRDVESGELAYKPVLRTTIRPTGKLLRIEAGSETYETSGGHLFWVSGDGWVKARQLKPGMVLHTADGPTRVTNVEPGQTAVTHNLVVADFNTYFVGNQKVLSHDNTVRRVTRAIVPGLQAE
ncbi:polymorphic toxin-type HINT domain-containing protein [Anatilimnocola sp. NA78]|uniref:polymorphic toxin-type HINT domain-containing protein n=1 Tax=Anatilimnocola sp. NA78 TaxID=3415683 RepID=UPI003CE5113A